MKILTEMRAVGIQNWIWLKIYLSGNEFSPKLDILTFKGTTRQLINARERAHRIDMILDSL